MDKKNLKNLLFLVIGSSLLGLALGLFLKRFDLWIVVVFLVSMLIGGAVITIRQILPMNSVFRYLEAVSAGEEISEIAISKLSQEYQDLAEIIKENDLALKESLKTEAEKAYYLLSVLNAMDNGLMALNLEEEVIMMNREAMKQFDIEQEEQYYLKNILQVTQNIKLRDIIACGRDGVYEEELLFDEEIYLLSVYPLKNQEGILTGRLIFFHNVTQIRNLENIRKEFVANVSHELKTPLTSIRGFIDTLKGGALEKPEVALKFLDIIDMESARLEGLIKDVLDLSDIENQKVIDNEELVDLNKILEDGIKILRQSAEEKHVTVTSQVEDNVLVWGNAHWLGQLLINLISNGIQYNKEGGTVDIEVYEKNKNLIIRVADTGIGISDEEKERIFERFYKVDQSRSINPQSTGLGLAIVKHLVGVYGGSIHLESKLNEGSIFKIVLPLKEGDVENEYKKLI